MSTGPTTQGEDSEVVTANAMTATPAFFRISDVVRITALSRATVYRRISRGLFPAPVHLGGRACGWTPASLQTWIADPGGYRAPAHRPVVNAGDGAEGRGETRQASARIASRRLPSRHQASLFSSA